jgi:RNA polymerase subunit RPABC4/transcription elongation factor Spt4
MSLVNCLECNKEISDKADKCINCGCPVKINEEHLSIISNKSTHRNYEVQVKKAVDVIFTIIYLFLLYKIFITDELPISSDSSYSFGILFGLFLGFGILSFIQKITKAILGTIARSFDTAFNSNKKQGEFIQESMRKCSHCAKLIPKEAKICKYCDTYFF